MKKQNKVFVNVFHLCECTLKDSLILYVSSLTPQVRPGSLICTRDDEHPRPFRIGIPPPGFEHLLFKGVLQSLALRQVSYPLNF